MQRYRPTSVLVIAILHLVGGGLGLLSDLCGLGSLFMADAGQGALSAPAAQRPGQPSPFSAADLMHELEKNAPAYRAYMIGAMALSFLLDVLLLAGGIGLLGMHAWARRVSLGYALLSIVMHVVTFVYQLLYIVPATNAFYERQPNLGGVGAMMGTITSISLFVSLLFVLYPIAVLIILLSPANAAAFRGEGQPPAEIPEYFPDDRWKEPPSEAIQR